MGKAGWANGEPQRGNRVGTCWLGDYFALHAKLKAKPEYKLDRELASCLPAHLPWEWNLDEGSFWLRILSRLEIPVSRVGEGIPGLGEG